MLTVDPPPVLAAPPEPVVTLPAVKAPAVPIPPEVRAMIEAAIANGDPASVATVARFARQACPQAAGQIDSMVGSFHHALEVKQAAAEHARRVKLAHEGPLEGWKGQVELGASRSTGSTRSLGAYAAIDLKRDTVHWHQILHARAETESTNGVVSKERIDAFWQPRYSLDDRVYTFGLAEYEHDPFLGFDSRYTLGTGAGYSLLNNPQTHLELEGGPALRETQFHDGGDRTSMAARASANFAWKIKPRLQFKETGNFFFESHDGSGTAVTELDAALFGPLKLKLSYELRYERDDFRKVDTLDTSSRATFVYAF